MIKITRHSSLEEIKFPLGILQVKFPPEEQWQVDKFRALADSEIALLKEKFAEYDRKAVFGENHCYILSIRSAGGTKVIK